MIIPCITVFLLLIGSGYLAACEMAISLSSKAKLHSLSKSGSKKAVLAEMLKDKIEFVISAILAVNTVFNAIATSIAAGICLMLVGEGGIAYASLLMGALILIYAEVLPKMIAINKPEKLIIKSAYFLKLLLGVARPIYKITNYIAKGTLYILGFKISEADSNASMEELRGVIDLHRGPNKDFFHERVMLKSVLDLRSVQVSEIMIHRKNVTMICADDPIDSIVDQVLSSQFSRLPLWQDTQDNIIGVVNVKALIRYVRLNRVDSLNIKNIASKPWFIPENTDLLEQLQMFKKKKEHFALVVDEYGALMGVVTLEDILEEIVGEINDEHDVLVRGVRAQSDGSYIVDGSVTIRDLNREFDWELPDEYASTVAGLLINSIRMIPNVGQVFMLFGFRMTVLKKRKNQITLIKLAKCTNSD